MGPEPHVRTMLFVVALFASLFFALAAWIPVGLLVRWVLVV